MTQAPGTPLAVVTGASSGIGLELAELVAADAHDLVLTAEDAELADAEQGIAAAGTRVEAVRVDLATAAAPHGKLAERDGQ